MIVRYRVVDHDGEKDDGATDQAADKSSLISSDGCDLPLFVRFSLNGKWDCRRYLQSATRSGYDNLIVSCSRSWNRYRRSAWATRIAGASRTAATAKHTSQRDQAQTNDQKPTAPETSRYRPKEDQPGNRDQRLAECSL